MKKITLLLTSACLLSVAASAGASVIVNTSPGTLYFTDEISTELATGYNMDGVSVKVFFSDREMITEATWVPVDSAAQSGGAFFHIDDNETPIMWSLAQSGDTFKNSWTFTYNNGEFPDISKIIIDGRPGDTIFDTTFNTSYDSYQIWGTDYSYRGLNFTVPNPPGTPFNITATYMDEVAITGREDAHGDLYRILTIDFTDNNFSPGSTLTFKADTDLAPGGVNPVPLPSALVLFGTGIAGLIGLRRKQGRIQK